MTATTIEVEDEEMIEKRGREGGEEKRTGIERSAPRSLWKRKRKERQVCPIPSPSPPHPLPIPSLLLPIN